MRFLTDAESREWAEGQGHAVSSSHGDAARQLPHVEVTVPRQASRVAFSRLISSCLEPRSSCLLWVVGHGVWPSSENWHLYYRVRQSYGDLRLLHEAPGHLFLDYEEADFVTYLQLALDSGWDVEILPRLSYGGAGAARAFISHDEFAIVAHQDPEVVEEWKRSTLSSPEIMRTSGMTNRY